MSGEVGNLYTVRSSAAISTVRTIIQVVAPSTRSLTMLRMWVGETGLDTAAQIAIEIVRKTGAGTTTAVTPVPLRPSQGTAAFTAGHNASAEGTVTDVLNQEGFGRTAGWGWQAGPDEQIEVPPSGILAIRFVVAPVSVTWRYGMTLVQVG